MSAPIIVHNLAHAQVAFAAAAELGFPLTLQSAPSAIFYAGSLYLLELFKKAQSQHPNVEARFILDCGDDGAETIAAMQMGHRHILSRAPQALHAKLSDIADQHGIAMVDASGLYLDLLHSHDAQAASKEWLLAHSKG